MLSMIFLSTLSLRRATRSSYTQGIALTHFYPRSPCGERPAISRNCRALQSFLSTLSLRRATPQSAKIFLAMEISIHALLAESDTAGQLLDRIKSYFYPRSPCGERPWEHTTPPPGAWISIHALLAESDLLRSRPPRRIVISIHALLAESDVSQSTTLRARNAAFLSTLSLRRATVAITVAALRMMISIHALLAESDSKSYTVEYDKLYFYPRSPCGERQFRGVFLLCCTEFLSTLSLRRATSPAAKAAGMGTYFYPRSPCGERLLNAGCCCVGFDFYPRSPCGERRDDYLQRQTTTKISIHALLAESDSARTAGPMQP